MKLAIMQPYFFPYIGYFQLMNSVDEFLIYDNIEFTKKGWINRNRILVNGKDAYISLPLKKDSDYLFVNQRFLADTWEIENKKLRNRIIESYRKAPYFEEAFNLIDDCISYPDKNLFNFIYNSLTKLKDFLRIETKLSVSSTIQINHSLKSEEKVIALCKAINVSDYINPIGGQELYSLDNFKANGIDLHFIKAKDIVYQQFQNEFVPWLSIIDIIMFNSKETIANYLNNGFMLV